jgi:hypothetical protein
MTLSWKAGRALGLLLGLCGASGCDKPITPPELIDKTRVLGAKVEVAGDATRAAPLPGEDVLVHWLVVAPDPNAAFAYELSACVAADSSSDLPKCAGDAIGTAQSSTPATAPPSIEFTAPADATGDERLAVLGAMCPAGQGLDATGTTCTDGSSVLPVSLDFSMDDGSHPNSNPALTDVSLDGTSLAAETSGSTDCTALPSFKLGKRRLSVELDPNSRDPLVPVNEGDPTRESLLLSYFVTYGELDHAFTAIDSGSTATGGSVIWTIPSRNEPLLVRLFVVVRDGRGGSDFAERRVCVTP